MMDSFNAPALAFENTPLEIDGHDAKRRNDKQYIACDARADGKHSNESPAHPCNGPEDVHQAPSDGFGKPSRVAGHPRHDIAHRGTVIIGKA